jgi:hypothetical protein
MTGGLYISLEKQFSFMSRECKQLSEQIFRLGPGKDITAEFFAIFSRFECALKSGNCYKTSKRKEKFLNNKRVEPDWDKYAEELEKNPAIKKEIEEAAAGCLSEYPPKIQVEIEKGVIDWEEPDNTKIKKTGIRLIFFRIKGVRNNLFHGGKFPGQEGSFDRRRDEELVQACLKVLCTCLKDEDSLVTKAFKNELE